MNKPAFPGFLFLPALFFSLLLGFQPFHQPESSPPKPMNFDTYEETWKRIDSLVNEGLPQSALELVVELHERAKAENNVPQITKTLLYQTRFEADRVDGGLELSIARLEREAEAATVPLKPILQSVLGTMYERYFNENQWRLSDRTPVNNPDNKDLSTWSADRIQQASAMHFFASTRYPELRRFPIGDYAAILQIDSNYADLRPTLYDVLLHRAIDYLSNERSYLSQPAYRFEMDATSDFAPAISFIRNTYSTRDTLSGKYLALLLFQDLLRYRLELGTLEPLIDADLKRLKFVYDNSVLEGKGERYLNALFQLEERVGNQPIVTDILYQQARWYKEEGSQYVAATSLEKERWYWKNAADVCRRAIRAFPETLGAKNCQSLLADLESRSLQVQVEEVNLPNQAMLALLDYKNIDKVFFRILPWSEALEKEYEKRASGRDGRSAAHRYLLDLRPLKSWNIALEKEEDLRMHSAEFAIEALPAGTYMLLASTSAEFAESDINGRQKLRVSNLAFWHRGGDTNQPEFVVYDRSTGQPLQGVKGEAYVRRYNNLQRSYDWKRLDRAQSDKDGFMRIKTGKDDRYFKVVLSKDQDTLDLDDSFTHYQYNREPQKVRKVAYFMDRAIYRPGQTVYFKALVLEHGLDGVPVIRTNEDVGVRLRDANYQVVHELQLRSNEYGTISGTFTAPEGGLLGQMHIETTWSSHRKGFRVEEYKRPRFEVTFQTPEESFRLGEQVRVQGKAMGLAGNPIDGATVQYRVVRDVRFPWVPWWFWRGGYFPQQSSVEMASGITQTDANGQYTVEFLAQPDRSVEPSLKPEFSYTVYATVVDMTGETREAQTRVNVGYIALNAQINLPEQMDVRDFQKISLQTSNLNGGFEPARGTVELQLLETPSLIYNQRRWNKPDRKFMSAEAFQTQFPQYAYDREDEIPYWKVRRNLSTYSFNTAQSSDIQIGKVKLEPGVYAVKLKTKDKYGMEVEKTQFLTLYDLKSKRIPVNQPLWHRTDKDRFEPGETALLYLGTAAKDVRVLFEVERNQQIIHREWVRVRNLSNLEYKVTEADRGNVQYHYNYAHQNRSWNERLNLVVPWTNKDLNITLTSFRDKLQPGQEEEWILKISGPKGERVAAEMVAAMYDASLDAFAPNSWSFSEFPVRYGMRNTLRPLGYGVRGLDMWGNLYPANPGVRERIYPQLLLFGANARTSMFTRRNYSHGGRPGMEDMGAMEVEMMAAAPPPPASAVMEEARTKSIVADSFDTEAVDENGEPPTDISETGMQIRSNLDETAFFFPELETDAEGNIYLRFTMKEALTRWKFLAFAHTPDLKSAITEQSVLTQKELMVLPNPPRFFREFDEIEYTAKVVNMTDKPLSGNAELQLVNPLNSTPVYKWLDNPQFNQNFRVEAGQSALLAWRFKVPDVAEVPIIEHTVVASAGNFSDGERSMAPVLTNRTLVTETLPLWVRGNERRSFVLKSLQTNDSETLKHQRFTLEFTSNPAWYAVQALPYLMEYPYECSEQIFSRFYANSLASSVANAHPKVKDVFDRWKGTDALESNLSKNQELKSALLQETPWVLQAQSEAEQKQNIGLLFDLNRMANEQQAALKKLGERQLSNGGFAWFPGGEDNWYITQYIAQGLGHLHQLGVRHISENPETWELTQKAVRYTDDRMLDHYKEIEKRVERKVAKWEDDHLDAIVIHYLYTRSFYLQNKAKGYIELPAKYQKAFDYFSGQADKYWLNKGLYQEGMLALALHRLQKPQTPAKILRSLKERSQTSEELGRFWKLRSGYFWYEHPIETQALLIEAFEEVAKDAAAVEEMKVWLLKSKQTTHWKTTKATAAAVYALLRSGDNWLLADKPVEVVLGNRRDAVNIGWQNRIREAQRSSEAGTGYFKVAFDGDEVDVDMSNITLQNPNPGIAWGGVFWQYFEDLDKVKHFEETPLTLKKELYKVLVGDRGEELHRIEEGAPLNPGDKVRVRIELRSDRAMEYLHLKDMRASGFEPVDVLSRYQWQDGLGYYQSPGDAATNFFISYLPKGAYVFEYSLRVVHRGDFSNGITTIQCMYAPEFSSHSEGVRVQVK
jgi:hypothetical protein